MVKIQKIHLSEINVPKKTFKKPKFLSVIKLAQFSGAEVTEKAKPDLAYAQKQFSIFELQQKLIDNNEKFKEIIKNSYLNLKSCGKLLLLDLNEKNISKRILSQLKSKRLLNQKFFKDLVNKVSDKIKIPYINKSVSEISPKQTFTVLNDSVMFSPRLAVHYIKGENTISHYMKMKNLKKIYSSCSVEELFNIKRKILKEFCKYTNTDCLIPDYKFSKTQMNNLKLLASKYDVIDELLKRHNIHTSAIETLLCSGIEKCTKSGDILPNKDVLLGFSNIYDKSLKRNIPAFLSFANTDIGYRFKLYRFDENLIKNIEKYKKQISYYIRTKNYKSVNDLDNNILEYLKNIEIAEVYAQPKDAKGLKNEMKRCSDMTEDKIEEVLNNLKNGTAYYLKDLKNYNKNKYYNVSIPLIKCLREFGKINNITEVHTEALAFNNVKHSPVGMYIRYGFEPISIPKEEIEKKLYSASGFDYKHSVWLVYKL